MDGSDSLQFDIGEFERKDSFASSTAWSSRVAPKSRGRRAYGRRASDRTIRNASLLEGKQTIKNNVDGDDEEVDTDVENNEQRTMTRSSTFSGYSEVPSPPIRRLKKWKTITGESPVTSQPKRPPKLMRSQSVSALMPNRRSSSSSRSSHSSSSSFASFVLEEGGPDFENFNPNFFPASNDVHGSSILEENTSPKRSAVVEGGKKGRKKCKPTNRSFLQNNDFSALNTVDNEGNNIRGNRNGSGKLPAVASDSFSDLARNYCEVKPAWITRSISCPSNDKDSREGVYRRRSHSSDLFSPSSHSFIDETMDGTDFVSSPTMSTASRKRGVCKSQFLIDESPVVRSRSRILSPSSLRTPDPSILMDTIDSKHRTASKLMNISFCSTKNDKNINRVVDLDVTMSDDDVYVSGDSDISVDSEDDVMATGSSNAFHSIQRPSSTRSTKIFEPEKATVDDVIRKMSSYEDIQFLSKSLKQNFEGHGGCLSWNIAPPVAWAAKRRDVFFQATRTLGFTFRAGGGNVSYIQISKTRGSRLLSLLNSTLATYDELKGRQSLPHAKANNSPKEFVFPSTIKKKVQPAKAFRLTPKELTSNSWWPKSADRSTEDLTQFMSNLNMTTKPSGKIKNGNKEILFNVNDDINDSHRHSGPSKSRKSSEYHSSSIDLNAQMDGATPLPSRLRGRPPRLSLQSVSSRTTLSSNMDTNSPFYSNSDMSKPTHINTHVNCSMNSNEFLLTPLIGRQNDGWGSRPFNNRDWGTSKSCGAVIIERLLHRFSQTRKRAGFNEGSDQMPSSDLRSSCLGLDFESVSQYCDEFESPTSLSSPGDTEIHELDPSHTGSYFSGSNNHNAEPSNAPFTNRAVRRRQTTFAKHLRMSLFASAVDPAQTFSKQRKSLFVRQPSMFPANNNQKIFLESAPEFFSQNTSMVVNESTCGRSSILKESPLDDSEVLRMIFDFLEETELLLVVGLVSSKWSDAATHSHANLMLSSVTHCDTETVHDSKDAIKSRRSWDYLTTTFPWACFLSEGAFKRVYKVFNHTCQEEEAISVMDVKQIHSTGNINVVGAELAVSVLLSSLVRRGICPNFVATRGMFSCQYEPPDNCWGTADNKRPKGTVYCPSKIKRRPREPKQGGHFQYIRMELCGEGDAEEFLKRQSNESLSPFQARNLLFQISFALYAAAEKFSLKHYDVKLLNIFLQRMPKNNGSDVNLRYGLGEHIFSLQSSREDAIIAKLADYGTANVDCVTNGQNVTIAQFTTLENTPPDFLILGDQALQGHGHDCFGLGLCMLHLFTGHAPYEEILEEVSCPSNLKKELRRIWENEEETQYSVVRSIVLADVYKDEDGHVIEGEADDTLYDTLYKFLVLFGIPDDSSALLNSKVMAAVKTTLLSEGRQKKGRCRTRKNLDDAKKFTSDRRKFSFSHGNNQYISRARTSLSSMDGGMDLLLSLVRFDPQIRASALDVLNSAFMAPLRERPNDTQRYTSEAEVLSFTAFSTQT